MNSAISYLRPHYWPIVKFILFFYSGGIHFLFFSLSLSLSTSLPPNPWLICDWPQISHQPSSRRPKASKPWWPTMSNGLMATHVIWTNPQPHMRFEATHDNPRWSEPTHGHPRRSEPHPRRATTTTNPRQSKADKPILRERRSFNCERKRGDSVMGLLVGLLVVAAMVEVFFFFFFLSLLYLVVVSGYGGCGCGCGCRGFFLLWFFFLFLLVVVVVWVVGFWWVVGSVVPVVLWERERQKRERKNKKLLKNNKETLFKWNVKKKIEVLI